MRAEAEARLGEKFDLREFHEQLLVNGSMPLGILPELVFESTHLRLNG